MTGNAYNVADMASLPQAVRNAGAGERNLT
jgi:hypothetical protein